MMRNCWCGKRHDDEIGRDAASRVCQCDTRDATPHRAGRARRRRNSMIALTKDLGATPARAPARYCTFTSTGTRHLLHACATEGVSSSASSAPKKAWIRVTPSSSCFIESGTRCAGIRRFSFARRQRDVRLVQHRRANWAEGADLLIGVSSAADVDEQVEGAVGLYAGDARVGREPGVEWSRLPRSSSIAVTVLGGPVQPAWPLLPSARLSRSLDVEWLWKALLARMTSAGPSAEPHRDPSSQKDLLRAIRTGSCLLRQGSS